MVLARGSTLLHLSMATTGLISQRTLLPCGIVCGDLASCWSDAVTASRYPTKNRIALDQFISPLDVATFDRDAATAYGRLRANLEQKGTPIGAMDLLIAAHALSLGVRLITNNAREFRRVPGLRIENWV